MRLTSDSVNEDCQLCRWWRWGPESRGIGPILCVYLFIFFRKISFYGEGMIFKDFEVTSKWFLINCLWLMRGWILSNDYGRLFFFETTIISNRTIFTCNVWCIHYFVHFCPVKPKTKKRNVTWQSLMSTSQNACKYCSFK